MLDASFVKAIQDSANTEILVVGEKSFSTKTVFNLPLPIEPRNPSVGLVSLDSLLDYIKADAETLRTAGAFVVCDEDTVTLQSKPQGENKQRDVFIKVDAGVQHFSFGQYMDLDALRLELLTKFSETVFRAQVLQFLSKITDSNVKTSEDDGISQTITVKAGIASYGQATVPSPIRLNPIRTFIEVEQPEGSFVLRLKAVKDSLPQAALYELHTNWKRAAAVAVKGYLDSKECPLPVFA